MNLYDIIKENIKYYIFESLNSQRQKYGNELVDQLKILDPTKTYKYIDFICKLYKENIPEDEIKKYIDIYNEKLNKNLIDKEHRDINKFKNFNEFKNYVDNIKDIKSRTEIKSQYGNLNSPLAKQQFYQTITSKKGTWNVYVPTTVEQSVQIQHGNTSWCTQTSNLKRNYFYKYRIIDHVTLYYFVNMDGKTTSVSSEYEDVLNYEQPVMYQIAYYNYLGEHEIYNNSNEELTTQEFYRKTGIPQSKYYKPIPMPDGHYEFYNGDDGSKYILNLKNQKYDGEYKVYYYNGQIKEDLHYKDGEKVGLNTYYYKNGNKEWEYKFDNNGNYEYDIHWYENGQIKEEEIHENKNGKDYATFVKYYENGQIKEKFERIGYTRIGKAIKYYSNGQVKEEIEYINGNEDYIKKEYYSNGFMYRETHYKNGKIISKQENEYKFKREGKPIKADDMKEEKINNVYIYKYNGKLLNGKYIEYDKGGNKLFEGEFKNGKPIGKLIWYDEIGNIYQMKSYKNGILNGKQITPYYCCGRTIEENYKDGKLDGWVIEYYDDSKIIYKKEMYKDGHEVPGTWEGYYLNGNIKYKSIKENDGHIVDIEYYENGNKKAEFHYKDGKLDGQVIKYYENGKMEKEEHYKNGKLDGQVIKYYENGKMESEDHYKNGVPVGEAVEYYKTGKRSFQYVYENGKVVKTIYYYTNGNIEEYKEKNPQTGETKRIKYDRKGKMRDCGIYKDGKYIRKCNKQETNI